MNEAANPDTTRRGADVPAVREYEVRPGASGSGFDLLSTALPGGKLWFEKEHVAAGYARLHAGAEPMLLRIFDADGRLTAVHELRAGASRETSDAILRP